MRIHTRKKNIERESNPRPPDLIKGCSAEGATSPAGSKSRVLMALIEPMPMWRAQMAVVLLPQINDTNGDQKIHSQLQRIIELLSLSWNYFYFNFLKIF